MDAAAPRLADQKKKGCSFSLSLFHAEISKRNQTSKSYNLHTNSKAQLMGNSQAEEQRHSKQTGRDGRDGSPRGTRGITRSGCGGSGCGGRSGSVHQGKGHLLTRSTMARNGADEINRCVP